MREIGQWIRKNGEALYATNPNPFKEPFEWGTITEKGDKLYLHIFDRPSQISIKGFDKDISDIYYLVNPAQKLQYSMDCQGKLIIDLHQKPVDDNIMVVVKIKHSYNEEHNGRREQNI